MLSHRLEVDALPPDLPHGLQVVQVVAQGHVWRPLSLLNPVYYGTTSFLAILSRGWSIGKTAEMLGVLVLASMLLAPLVLLSIHKARRDS